MDTSLTGFQLEKNKIIEPINLQKDTYSNISDSSIFDKWHKNLDQDNVAIVNKKRKALVATSLDNSLNVPLSEEQFENNENDSLNYFEVDLDFDEISKTFIDDQKGRSQSFIEVADALEAVKKEKNLFNCIKEGGLGGLSSDEYEKYLRLNEALTIYINGHMGARWKAGKNRLDAAYKLRKMLERAARISVGKKVFDTTGVDEKLANEYANDKNEAFKNIDNMCDYYRAYCRQISEDMVSTVEEKIWARWNVLKTCERDIRIMSHFLSQSDKYKNKERVFIEREYLFLKSQIELINNRVENSKEKNESFSDIIRKMAHSHMEGKSDKKNEENRAKILIPDESLEESVKQNKPDNSDENFNVDQLKGLQEIDRWVIRNIRNGGYMTFGLNKTDRTDFASKLLSLSKKERMYIYYLVETKERVKPSMEGLVKSQISYVPNLSAFKNRMVASKFKFYTRFSGGYIHWNKLSEAMAIAGQATKPMEFISEAMKKPSISVNLNNNNNNNEQNDEAQQDNNIVNTETQKLQEIFGVLLDIMILNEKQEYKGIKVKKEEANIKQNDLRKKLGILAKELDEVKENIVGNIDEKSGDSLLEKPQKNPNQYKNMENQLLEKAGVDNYITDKVLTVGAFGENFFTPSYTLLTNVQSIANISNACYSISTGAVGAVSGLIGVVGGLLMAAEGYNGMSKFEVASLGTGIFLGAASVVNAAGVITKTIDSTNKVGKIIGSSGVGMGLAVAAVGLNAVKTGSYLSKGRSRKQASKIANKVSMKNKEDKFRKGMLELNRHLGKKQRTESYSGLASAAFAAGIMFAPIALPIIAAATIFVTIGQTIAVKISNDSFMKKMRADLNNSFFNMDDFMNKTGTNEFNKKIEGRNLSEKQKMKLKEKFERQIMRRISSELGFYSPNHLATAVAMKFADYLLIGVKNDSDKDQSEMCRKMIEGLGLQCKLDKGVPRPSDIAKALCG